MSRFVVVFVTCPDKKSAQKLAKILLNQKLAACVSVQPGLESFYWWQGKVQRAREVLLIIKSAQKLFDALTACLQAHHPYSVPEIIALPVAKGSTSYIQWLSSNLTVKK